MLSFFVPPDPRSGLHGHESVTAVCDQLMRLSERERNVVLDGITLRWEEGVDAVFNFGHVGHRLRNLDARTQACLKAAITADGGTGDIKGAICEVYLLRRLRRHFRNTVLEAAYSADGAPPGEPAAFVDVAGSNCGTSPAAAVFEVKVRPTMKHADQLRGQLAYAKTVEAKVGSRKPLYFLATAWSQTGVEDFCNKRGSQLTGFSTESRIVGRGTLADPDHFLSSQSK